MEPLATKIMKMDPSKRIDGRLPEQPRALKITPGFLPTAEGSALIETGNTKVICTASVEDTVPHFKRGSGQGWVTAEYAMLPRSTNTRTAREVTRGKPSGRTSEIQRLIGRALRASVDFKKLGERSILIDCDVLQADGGTRTAAITGAWVALALAVKQLREFGAVNDDPLVEQVAAVSVGVVGGVPMLDLCYEEDSRADVDMNVVMTAKGEFVELQATAEQRSFPGKDLEEMLRLAKAGIDVLLEALDRGPGALRPCECEARKRLGELRQVGHEHLRKIDQVAPAGAFGQNRQAEQHAIGVGQVHRTRFGAAVGGAEPHVATDHQDAILDLAELPQPIVAKTGVHTSQDPIAADPARDRGQHDVVGIEIRRRQLGDQLHILVINGDQAVDLL